VAWGKLSECKTQRITRIGQEEFQPNLERVRRVLRLRREFWEEGKSSKGKGDERGNEGRFPGCNEVNKQGFPIVGSSLGKWRIKVGVKGSYSRDWVRTQDRKKGLWKKDVNKGNCSYCLGIREQFLYSLEGSKRGIPKLGSTKNRYCILS
jgi:hypothetical protein